jgi:hypothetical protein
MSEDLTKKEDMSHGSHNSILLGQSTQLDLSSLSEVDRTEMVRRFAEGRIELARKAGELAVENQALDQRLDGMVDTVMRASESGTSATLTGAYNDNMGRTEIIMGNTETAAKGKLSRSQAGEKDMTLFYVMIAAIVIVIIVAIVGK